MEKNTDQVIEAAKASYYKPKLKDADSKTVYSTINAFLNKNQKILPTGDCNTALSHKFARYFVEKIDTLRPTLDSQEDSTPEMSYGISLPRGDSMPSSRDTTNINLRDLTQFDEVSSDEVFNKACTDTIQQVLSVESNSIMAAEVCHLCATHSTDQHHQFIS